jgi:DNA-directed RNA polymerase subunit RPC12/RpoP
LRFNRKGRHETVHSVPALLVHGRRIPIGMGQYRVLEQSAPANGEKIANRRTTRHLEPAADLGGSAPWLLCGPNAGAVTCTHCGHRGLIPKDMLPRSLKCSRCGSRARFERGDETSNQREVRPKPRPRPALFEPAHHKALSKVQVSWSGVRFDVFQGSIR